jgi:hypothetical protein
MFSSPDVKHVPEQIRQASLGPRHVVEGMSGTPVALGSPQYPNPHRVPGWVVVIGLASQVFARGQAQLPSNRVGRRSRSARATVAQRHEVGGECEGEHDTAWY